MEGFKKYLRELTVSPDYQSRGTFNPFYVLDIPEDDIRPSVGDGEIKYKNVDSGSGELIKNYGGKYHFQINVNDEDTNYYVITTKSKVKAHFGQKTRKDSTASSNVNEFLTVYFLLHKDYTDPKTFQSDIGGKTGKTGVLNGEGQDVTYEDLIQLIDRDETADRDIEIGYQNSLAVKKDLPSTIDKVFWVPRGKPDGVGGKNPSDVIIKLSDGNYVGYSNKIAAGKDATPKINTNMTAFYSKLSDRKQLLNIQKMINLFESNGYKCLVDQKVMEDLCKRGYHPDYGARPIKRLIKSEIVSQVSKYILKDQNTKEINILYDNGIKVAGHKASSLKIAG